MLTSQSRTPTTIRLMTIDINDIFYLFFFTCSLFGCGFLSATPPLACGVPEVPRNDCDSQASPWWSLPQIPQLPCPQQPALHLAQAQGGTKVKQRRIPGLDQGSVECAKCTFKWLPVRQFARFLPSSPRSQPHQENCNPSWANGLQQPARRWPSPS